MTTATAKIAEIRVPGPSRMGMTSPDQPLAQRIIARASGRESVSPGDVLWADVDFAMIQDSGGPRRLGPALERLKASIWETNRLSVVCDHYVPGSDIGAASIIKLTREFAHEHSIERYHEAEGISHTLMVERGYVHPGMLYIGGDSHSCTAGVLGGLALGMGSTDMLGVLVEGKTWLRVPDTIGVNLANELPVGTSTKDVVLQLIGEHTMDGATYRVLEFGGTALQHLDIDERSVLTNMSAELGAKTGIIPADEVTWAYLKARGIEQVAGYETAGTQAYGDQWNVDVAKSIPLVALPDSVEDVAAAADVKGASITRAYLGACTGAKTADLHQAAEVLKGRKVAPGVLLQIAPASRAVLRRAMTDGTAETLMAAGAHFLSTGCGACPGISNGVLAAGDVCVATTNRNFKGRMGSPDAQVYLSSAYTAAASAVAGRICDPRELL